MIIFVSQRHQGQTMRKQVSIIWFIISAILIVLTGALIGYVYWQRNEMKAYKEQVLLEAERERLEEEYAAISQEYSHYEGHKAWLSNDSLVQQLDREKQRVQRLLEELRTRKDFNTATIDSLQSELKTLRNRIRIYQAKIDSLSQENKLLQAEKDEALNRYKKATQAANQLQKDNEALSEKVNQAAQLGTSELSIATLNKWGRKSKDNDKIEKIKISFVIDHNPIAATGEKNIYVCIKKPDGSTLVKDRTNSFIVQGNEYYYSLHQIIDYMGVDEKLYFQWKVEEYLPAGEYIIELYADSRLIGQGSFSLEE